MEKLPKRNQSVTDIFNDIEGIYALYVDNFDTDLVDEKLDDLNAGNDDTKQFQILIFHTCQLQHDIDRVPLEINLLGNKFELKC